MANQLQLTGDVNSSRSSVCGFLDLWQCSDTWGCAGHMQYVHMVVVGETMQLTCGILPWTWYFNNEKRDKDAVPLVYYGDAFTIKGRGN